MSTPEPVVLGIAGALGRMGKAVAAHAAQTDGVSVGVLFDRPEMAGELIGESRLQTAEAAMDCAVVVDFSLAEAATALAEACAAAGRPALVIGATGFSDAQNERIRAASAKVAIVKSGNYSIGVNMLLGLVRRAAATLGPEAFDIEVFEAHHKRKIDAPSGTALMLGEAAAQGRGVDLAAEAVRGRDGLTGARPQGAIGFSVLRGGGIIGEHTVTFAGEEEILTLSHSARDRGLFARGAVRAAQWVVGKPPGLYDMLDVLGLGLDD